MLRMWLYLVGRLLVLSILDLDSCIICLILQGVMLNLEMLHKYFSIWEIGLILMVMLLMCLYIKRFWSFRDDFTRILSIFLILFFTIFYLCICSLFLEIFLFLLAVLFGKTFVFRIVVCQFELKLFRWLVERLSVEFLY